MPIINEMRGISHGELALRRVLTLRREDLDFVQREKDLGVVVQWIEDRLTGREEVVSK